MKHYLRILPIVTAIMAMIVFSTMPHHHHLMKVCFAMEKCGIDGHINDQHTNHQESSDHETDCKFFAGNTVAQQSSARVAADFGCLLLLLLVPLLCDIHYWLNLFSRSADYSRFHISFYKSLLLCSSGGFRAPPVGLY